MKKTVCISLATAGATAINIALNYLMIPQYGYIAAAYTTVIGYGISWMLHYIVCKRTIYKDLFEKKVVITNVGICLGAMVLTLILYRNNVLRISVIVLSTLIVTACGIKNRNRLREYLRK